MRGNWCGQHDCFDCYHLIELGRYGNEVSICLYHKVQIVPADGLKCDNWRWEDDGPDNLHDNAAMECSEQKDNQSLSDEE